MTIFSVIRHADLKTFPQQVDRVNSGTLMQALGSLKNYFLSWFRVIKVHRPFSIFMQVRGQRVQNEGECTQAKLLIACTYKVQRTFGTVRCNDTQKNLPRLRK